MPTLVIEMSNEKADEATPHLIKIARDIVQRATDEKLVGKETGIVPILILASEEHGVTFQSFAPDGFPMFDLLMRVALSFATEHGGAEKEEPTSGG